MFNRTVSTRQSTAPANETSDSQMRQASGDIETINREWLGLRDLTYYAHVSERTIRSWIRSPVNPLPAVKVSGKVLVRKSDFDAFLQRFRIRPSEEIDIDSIVRDVLKGEGDGR
jgi:helix-turn-helix protein